MRARCTHTYGRPYRMAARARNPTPGRGGNRPDRSRCHRGPGPGGAACRSARTPRRPAGDRSSERRHAVADERRGRPGHGEYPAPEPTSGLGPRRGGEGDAIRVDQDRDACLTPDGLAAAMADRVSLLVGDGHAELTGRVPRARRRQVADQAGVQRAQAMRLTGPFPHAQEGEQRERQVPADGHQG